jgi:hypothetical protein
MKRRDFLGTTGVLMARRLINAQPAPGQLATRGAGQPHQRASKLFDNPGLSPRTIVQDVQVFDNLVYCLYQDRVSNYWGVTATTVSGNIVRRHRLPGGTYLSLGRDADSILLHALTYTDPAGRMLPHCILSLQTTGYILVLDSKGQDFGARLQYAGPSFFIRADSGAISVWTLYGSSLTQVAAKSIPQDRADFHVDLLQPGTVALTRDDGASMLTVDVATANIQTHIITLPEIASARAAYRETQPMADPATAGRPVVIPATGSDGAGLLYGLVFPSPPDAVTSIILDATAKASLGRVFRFTPRSCPAPIKLIPSGQELGIAFADGSVSWYAR